MIGVGDDSLVITDENIDKALDIISESFKVVSTM